MENLMFTDSGIKSISNLGQYPYRHSHTGQHGAEGGWGIVVHGWRAEPHVQEGRELSNIHVL